ncbi:unnamed protein product [Blepharisma stoltei]|uniref:Uncharacterized protein n=1 Tax=Blepharisma stoltei TaxID=1481888 RepID=A0AAU9IR39_9CILI|nr:unnamed protein product [Blepharisma stoltei]
MSFPLELDTTQLIIALDSISHRLSSPYLSRRNLIDLSQVDIAEELKYTIQELIDREKEFLACIGIAKELIKSNENLKAQINQIVEKKRKYKCLNSQLYIEIERYKSEIHSYEEKYTQANNALQSCEEELLVLTAENSQVLVESEKLKKLPDFLRKLIVDYENRIETQKEILIKQISSIEESKLEKEKTYKKKIRDMEEQMHMLKTQQTIAKSIEQKYLKSIEQINFLEKELEDTKNNYKKYSKVNNELIKSVELLKVKNEKLQEELEVNKNTCPVTKQDWNKETSLFNEIQYLDEQENLWTDVSDEENNHSPSLSKNALRDSTNSFLLCSPIISKTRRSYSLRYSNDNFSWTSCKKPRYLANPIRKDPGEEYFILATQAIKMNLPFMHEICRFPANELYKKAVAEDVPFNKWHTWIENQLTLAYYKIVQSNIK